MTASSSNSNTNPTPSYPAQPDVTVNVTELTLGDSVARQRQIIIDKTQIQNSSLYTIPYTPITNQSVKLYKNGVLQTQGIDYAVGGTTLELRGDCVLDPPKTDKWVFLLCFLSTDGETSAESDILKAGQQMTWLGSVNAIPPGWVYADGSTLDQTIYSLLFAEIGHQHATNAADEIALEAAGEFRLPGWSAEAHDPPNTLLVPFIIYTGNAL